MWNTSQPRRSREAPRERLDGTPRSGLPDRSPRSARLARPWNRSLLRGITSCSFILARAGSPRCLPSPPSLLGPSASPGAPARSGHRFPAPGGLSVRAHGGKTITSLPTRCALTCGRRAGRGQRCPAGGEPRLGASHGPAGTAPTAPTAPAAWAGIAGPGTRTQRDLLLALGMGHTGRKWPKSPSNCSRFGPLSPCLTIPAQDGQWGTRGDPCHDQGR